MLSMHSKWELYCFLINSINFLYSPLGLQKLLNAFINKVRLDWTL